MSRDFLQSHIGPESPLVLGFNPLDNSPWLARKWRVAINSVLDRRDIQPDTPGQYSNTTVYKIPKIAEKITKVQHIHTVSALARVGGTYARFEDFAGFDHIDNIQISYAGNLIQTIYGMQLYLWHRMHKRQDKQDAEAILVAGNRTVAERNADSAAAQTWVIDVPCFFTYETHSSFPIMVLADELRWETTFRPLAAIVQSDAAVGNVTGTLTQQLMRVWFVHNIQLERDMMKTGVNEGNGLIFPILDVERQNLTLLPSGNQSFNVRLTNAKAPCSYFQFFIRKNSNINVNHANTFNAFENLREWDMTANAQPLKRTVEHDYNLYHINPLYYEGTPRDSIYGDSFSLVPENKYDCNGSNYFAMQNNPTLNITMPAVLGENHYSDVYLYVENFIQVKGPDVVKIFK
jgi:hypothetical protein